MTFLGSSGQFVGCYLKIGRITILLTLQRHKPLLLCECRVPLEDEAKLGNLKRRNENKDINFFHPYDPNWNSVESKLSV
jgi:hypothetical protein